MKTEPWAPSPLTLERAVELLSTMAHPVRLGVLARLHRVGPASVGELVEALRVEQSVLSHHLSHLREARLVVGERDGRRIIYRLHDAHVGHLVEDTLGYYIGESSSETTIRSVVALKEQGSANTHGASPGDVPMGCGRSPALRHADEDPACTHEAGPG